MKTGTKIGWLLLAMSIMISIWVIVGQQNKAAEHIDEAGYSVDEQGVLIGYPSSESVTIPNAVDGISVTGISENLFANDQNVVTVVISDSVRDIGTGFAGCSNLKGVYVGAGVGNISSEMFEGDTSLTYISVDEGNPYYSSSQGCVYNENGDNLLVTPPGTAEVENLVITEEGETAETGEDINAEEQPEEEEITSEHALIISAEGGQVSIGLPAYAADNACIIYRATPESGGYQLLAVTAKGRASLTDRTAVKGVENSYYACLARVENGQLVMEEPTDPVTVTP